jgi:transcriptional regulator with XRE-family HTH domain
VTEQELPTGRALPAVTDAEEPSAAPDSSPEGYDPVQLELAVRLRLRGMTWREIADKTGVRRATIWAWSRKPEWQQIARRLVEEEAQRLTHVSLSLVTKWLENSLHGDGPPRPAVVARATRIAELVIPLVFPRQGQGQGEGGASAVAAVVVLPPADAGQPGLTAIEVLSRNGR